MYKHNRSYGPAKTATVIIRCTPDEKASLQSSALQRPGSWREGGRTITSYLLRLAELDAAGKVDWE